MQAKPRRPRRRKPRSNSWLLMAAVWLPVAFLLPRFLQNNFSVSQDDSPRPSVDAPARTVARRPPSFEDAFQAVTGLAQQIDQQVDLSTREGITQTQYDRWRQSQGQPHQPIANLQPSEVKAIYQTYWQQGNCGSYAKPLDIACLDTMLAFGVEDGSSFFAGLSPDPQQAAIEVAQRRLDYRQRQQNSSLSGATPLRPEGLAADPRSLMAGMARDQALQAFLIADRTEQNQPGTVRIATRQRDSAQTNPQANSGDSVRITSRPPLPAANSPTSGSQNLDSQNPNSQNPNSQNPDVPNEPSWIPGWSGIRALLPDWLRPRNEAPLSADLDPKILYANTKPFTVEVWIYVDSGYAPATGIIVRSDGLILTNYHVISNNPTPSIQLADGRKFNGRLITSDASIDLALLQIQGASGLPTANLADSTRDVQAGDTVYAIGSPMGTHWKMSRAQVMNTKSLCGSRALDHRCIRTPGGFLYPGNSGGPLLNTKGEVIGVNRAIQESTGQGVSIPIEIVQQFLARVQP